MARMDLFVANDTVQNVLFANRGPGKTAKSSWNWKDISLAAEVAFSESGQPRSGMGVDAADVFGSGYQDLLVANVDQEMFSLARLKQPSRRTRTCSTDAPVIPCRFPRLIAETGA
jgi:hypothetical protein